jgi:MGT family glycosyltransferase
MRRRFLIATMPVPGHVAPFVPLVRELLRLGHEVVWYGSRYFQRNIEATGARFTPMRTGVDFGDSQYDRHFPERTKYSGLKQVVFDFEKLFVESIPGMLQDLTTILEEYAADVLIGDPAVAATRILSETKGFPAAVLNITVVGFETRDMAAFGLGLRFSNSPLGRLRNRLSYLVVDHIVFRPVNRKYRALATKYGWPIHPFRPSVSQYLHLQPMVPSFEYPISDMPPQLHFIGVLLPAAPSSFQPPAWWDKVLQSGKRIVLVTQGTIATNADELIRPTLAALADEDMWVIATTGGKRGDELGFAIPANAVVEPFVPFVTLMPHVTAFVTNGGYGGICIALAFGVPVVSAGTTEDKMEVGNRVAYSGVGLNLKTSRPKVAQIRSAVRAVLSDPSYAARARAIRDELATHNAASEAVALLEQLATTRKPVTPCQVCSIAVRSGLDGR